VANYELVNDVGAWFFHALIVSPKLTRMTENEEANHQNKPRGCNQFEGTYQIDAEGTGTFVTLASLEPEYTALLFGVHVIDSDGWAGTTFFDDFPFPTGAGIGPFLRPPIMTICASSFAIPDASSGRDWQAASVAAATNESGVSDWILACIAKPYTASGYDNYKNGMPMSYRIAGFDGQAPSAPNANTNYYLFWHAVGPVAAYL
jgi:hypothetical protein